MSRYIAIDASQHSLAGWLPYTDYRFAAHQALAPVSLEEVPNVLKSVPLAFRRLKNGRYQLVALQSLTHNTNLCVAPNGRWISGYIPALYRAYPFRLLPTDSGQQWSLCLDLDSGLWLDDARDQGRRFFNDQGEDSEWLAPLRTFLNKVMRGQAMAARAVNFLEQTQVIQPWPLKTQRDDDDIKQVDGLYRIDEKRLNALPPEKLVELRDSGALSIAYAQLFSQHRLNNLSELYRLHHAAASRTDRLDKESLDELFDENDDIQLDFDT